MIRGLIPRCPYHGKQGPNKLCLIMHLHVIICSWCLSILFVLHSCCLSWSYNPGIICHSFVHLCIHMRFIVRLCVHMQSSCCLPYQHAPQSNKRWNNVTLCSPRLFLYSHATISLFPLPKCTAIVQKMEKWHASLPETLLARHYLMITSGSCTNDAHVLCSGCSTSHKQKFLA